MSESSTRTGAPASAESPIVDSYPDAPRYLTMMQAGERIGSKPWPIMNLARAGKLRTVRYGELVLVATDDVDAHADYLRKQVLATPEAVAALEIPLQAIKQARGTSHTVASLAEECAVEDPEEPTRADVEVMTAHIGGSRVTCCVLRAADYRDSQRVRISALQRSIPSRPSASSCPGPPIRVSSLLLPIKRSLPALP